ncbi:MAG: alpha/beta fold hydrolase [Pseudoclavibacter sp.]
MREQLVAPDGVTISYTVTPSEGETVVLLHGLAGSSREMQRTADVLDQHRVVLVDQRGHGCSTTRPGDTSRRAFVEDVALVIEAVSTEPVTLVGQSMGAHTAMLVAATRPDLVKSLVMLEGNQGGGSADEARALGDFFRSWPVPFPDRAAAAAALGDGPLQTAWIEDLQPHSDGLRPPFDPDVMQAIAESMTELRWADWENVTASTLVIYADGGMFTEAQKDEFVRRGRNVRRVDLFNASHDAHLDAFEAWSSALKQFLDAQ